MYKCVFIIVIIVDFDLMMFDGIYIFLFFNLKGFFFCKYCVNIIYFVLVRYYFIINNCDKCLIVVMLICIRYNKVVYKWLNRMLFYLYSKGK